MDVWRQGRFFGVAGLVFPWLAGCFVSIDDSLVDRTGPITFVQSVAATPQDSPMSVAVSFSRPLTTGDFVVAAVGWNSGAMDVVSVSDDAANTYDRAGDTIRHGALSQVVYYATGVAQAGAMTVQFSGPVFSPDVRVAEYRGVAVAQPFDAMTSAAADAGTANSGPPPLVASSGELLLAAGITTGFFSGPGQNWAQRLLTIPDGDLLEEQVAPSAGSYTATAPVSGPWLMQLASFRPLGPSTP
jgi:hypothetical protein